jgi:hypothetical protein
MRTYIRTSLLCVLHAAKSQEHAENARHAEEDYSQRILTNCTFRHVRLAAHDYRVPISLASLVVPVAENAPLPACSDALSQALM